MERKDKNNGGKKREALCVRRRTVCESTGRWVGPESSVCVPQSEYKQACPRRSLLAVGGVKEEGEGKREAAAAKEVSWKTTNESSKGPDGMYSASRF